MAIRDHLLNGAAELHAFGAVETGLERARTAADRIAAVADTPDPVRRPDRPFPPPERPVTVSISAGSVTYPGQETPAVLDIDLDRARRPDWITSLPRGWDTPVGTRGTHAELVRAGGVYQRLWYSACSRRTA